MSQDSSAFDTGGEDEEPLYTDEHGVPMLFDVVVPGDYVKAAGVLLDHRRPEFRPALDGEAVRARVEKAVEAVMPAVVEQASRMIREAIDAELQGLPRGAAEKN